MSTYHKSVLQIGNQKPDEHDRVSVELSVSLNNKIIVEDQSFDFDVGFSLDFGVMPVIDKIVQSMGLNEICEVFVAVDDNLSDIEKKHFEVRNPSDELKFRVHLKDIKKLAEFWQMSEAEKFLLANIMKRRGNDLMKVEQISRAFKCYKKAIRILEGSVSVIAGPNEKKEFRELLAICLTNASLCLFKHGTLSTNSDNSNTKKSPTYFLISCIRCCKRAIELNPNYSKAWFRLGKAHAAMCNYDEAYRAGEECLKCLNKENNQNGHGHSDEPRSIDGIYNTVQNWHKLASNATKAERDMIRERTLRKYSAYTGDWWCDDDDEIEKLEITTWSNDLAKNMMSLEEELEAFGEKMPEVASNNVKFKNRNKLKLSTIQDDE